MERIRLFLTLLLGSVFLSPGYATTVGFHAVSVGNGEFEYRYTIRNDTLTEAIHQVTIYFDAQFYADLRVAGAASDWDALVVQPDLNFPTPVDGFYDALALRFGIGPGASASSFAVRFRWMGKELPGTQPFEIIDPLSFQLLDAGNTLPDLGPAADIPTLSTWHLLLLAALLLFIVWWRLSLFRTRDSNEIDANV